MSTPRSSMTIPSTQNTAPIFDFACLYTFDLRRKTKRWQDGFLRFHTFNKRVMVYDVPRNFIGDTHWRHERALAEGDDLNLDKGVVVEVGEQLGRQEQDLAPLFAKRGVLVELDAPVVVSAAAVGATAAAAAPAAAALARTTNSAAGLERQQEGGAGPLTSMRPKTLNALLGVPRGRYGRAVLPKESPFVQRQQENTGDEAAAGLERLAKRRRLDTTLPTTKVTAIALPPRASLPPPPSPPSPPPPPRQRLPPPSAAEKAPRKNRVPEKPASERPKELSEAFVVDSDSAEELASLPKTKTAVERTTKAVEKKMNSAAKLTVPGSIKPAKLDGSKKPRARADVEEDVAEKSRAAKGQTLKRQVEKLQAPFLQDSRAQPKAQVSKAQTSSAETSKAQASKAQASKAQVSKAQVSKAQVSKIHSSTNLPLDPQAASPLSNATPEDAQSSSRPTILQARAHLEKEGHRNLLRTAPSKARKKLMHRALLPAKSASITKFPDHRSKPNRIYGVSTPPAEDEGQSKRTFPKRKIIGSKPHRDSESREQNAVRALSHPDSQNGHSARKQHASVEAFAAQDPSVASAELESLFVTQSSPPDRDDNPPVELAEDDRRSLLKSFGTTRDVHQQLAVERIQAQRTRNVSDHDDHDENDNDNDDNIDDEPPLAPTTARALKANPSTKPRPVKPTALNLNLHNHHQHELRNPTAQQAPPQPQPPPEPPSPLSNLLANSNRRKQASLVKSLSEPKARAPTKTPPLARALSDLTGSAAAGGALADAAAAKAKAEAEAAIEAQKKAPKEAQSKDCGPWGVEAFDLFGWRPGDEKGKSREAKRAQGAGEI